MLSSLGNNNKNNNNNNNSNNNRRSTLNNLIAMHYLNYLVTIFAIKVQKNG